MAAKSASGERTSIPRSQALAFWRLLETGAKVPHGSAHITVDGRLALVIAKRTGIHAAEVFAALYGRPVKAAHGVVGWMERGAPDDPVEQGEMLSRWAARRPVRASGSGKRGAA